MVYQAQALGAGLGELGVTWGQLRKSLKFYAKESDLYFEGKGHLLKDFFFCREIIILYVRIITLELLLIQYKSLLNPGCAEGNSSLYYKVSKIESS